jgi:UDP:flavonoid glycosyltransferase YjiC (YdhE family)
MDVAAVGAGTCLMPDALDADVLRRAVRDAISMRRGAQDLADALARSGGAPAAAAALESQLALTIEGAESR